MTGRPEGVTDPLSHRDGHDTEHLAAGSVAEQRASIEKAVLDALIMASDSGPLFGLTDDEGAYLIEGAFPHADRLTFGRRRHELAERGLVVDSGLRRTTPRGRSAIVWRYLAPGVQ